jgi:hypothetical protein
MKLKFAIAESLEDTYTTLTERLRETELDWEMVKEGNNKYFTTKFNNIEVFIRENSVVLNVYTEDGTHESRERKLTGRSELYKGLSKRFKEDSDYKFYTGIVTTLNEMEEGQDDADNNKTGGTIVS